VKLHDVFPSQWLAAADVEQPATVTIRDVTTEEVGRGKELKPVVWFEELDKGLICNKTNWQNIAKLAGSDESDDWRGKQVQLYATLVQFGGEEVNAVRVRPLGTGARTTPKPAAPKPGNGNAARNQAFADECKALFVGDTAQQIGAHISAAMVACDLDGNWRELSDGDLARVLAALKESLAAEAEF